ncbi:MAG: LysR family transcriptional regulator, partial [Clostridiales bacterium]|nr:LysR family transcriptional regulator [Clostridiales bacterium]
MEFRQISTFIQVANFQSFSKAAEYMGYTQSAVTVHIRNLESELGTQLFDRIGKRVILTAQGEQFLESARHILYEVDKAKYTLSDDHE